MQITGGGAPGLDKAIGRRKRIEALRARANETSDNATPGHRAADYDPGAARYRPGGPTPEDREAVMRHEGGFEIHPADVLRQTWEYPGRLYHDADMQFRGLLNTLGAVADNTIHDRAPLEGMEADPIIHETWHNWTHPTEYATEHPAGFLFDAAAVATGGAGLLRNAAERAGMTVPEFLSAETGAIGPLGKRMEDMAARGEEAFGVRNATGLEAGETPGIVASAETFPDTITPGAGTHFRPRSSAAQPNFGMIDLVEGDTGLGLLKPAAEETKWGMDQIGGELAYQDLNRRLGSRVRMPGSVRADFDYAPVQAQQLHGNLPRWRSTVEDIKPTEGLGIEFVPGAEDAGANAFTGMEHADDLRNITMMDYITANTDRDFVTGHNLMKHEGRPLAIDQGLAMQREVDDFYADPGPGVVPPGWQSPPHAGSADATPSLWMGATPTPQQWPGFKLSPEDADYLLQARGELQAALEGSAQGGEYNALFENSNPWAIQSAIKRIDNALARGSLFAEHPYVAGGGAGAPAHTVQDLLAQLQAEAHPSWDESFSMPSRETELITPGWRGPNGEVDDILDEWTTLGPDEIPGQEDVSLNSLMDLLRKSFKEPL